MTEFIESGKDVNEWRRQFGHLSVGGCFYNLLISEPIVSKEGVVVASMYVDFWTLELELDHFDFYSDEGLLNGKETIPDFRAYYFYIILPIDK